MIDKSYVSVIKGKDIKNTVREAINLIGGIGKFVKKGETVLIKPNLVYPYSPPATTNPEVIKVVGEFAFEAGAKEVWIGDSSTYTQKPLYGTGKWTNQEILEIDGIVKIAQEIGAKVIDFDKEETVKIEIPEGIILREVEVFRPVIDADVIINVPVLKMHFQTLVTLGIKNLHGIIPDKWKLQFHRDEISQKVVDLHKVVKPRLTIVDGTKAMQGLGPRVGTDVEMDLIIAGKDVVAVDAVSSEIMGVKSMEVETNRLAYTQGIGNADMAKIVVLGEKIEDVRKKLKRPDVSIAGVFPGINVIEGGVCVHCYGRARIFLDTLFDLCLPNNADISLVIIGVQPKVPDVNEIKGNVLIVGDCAIYSSSNFRQALGKQALCLDGCPPMVSVHRLIDKLKERYVSKTAFKER